MTYETSRPDVETTRIAEMRASLELWFSATSAILHSINSAGRLVAVSDAWLAKFGYARDEVIGRRFSDFLAPESQEHAIRDLSPEFFERGRCENMECQIVCRDGRVIDVLSSTVLDNSAVGHKRASLAVITDVTALKAAERRSAESEALYRGLVEDQRELVSLATPEGELRFVNHAYARLYERLPQEMVGKSLFDFVPTDGHKAVAEHLRRVCTVDHSVEDENQVVLSGGQTRWVAWTNRAHRDVTGKITAIHSVGRDIDPRVAAEQRLKESEARYRLLADNITDMVFQLDLDLVRRYVSPASREILGYEPEEMIGVKPISMAHPDDAAHTAETFRAVLNGLERTSVTNRIRHRDGHCVWVEAELRLVRDAKTGAPLGILGTARDVSRRKAVESALAESEARYRLLADNTSDVIILKPSPAGPRSYVSPAIHTLLGYDTAEFAAIPMCEIVHPDDYEKVMACYAALTSENTVATNVHRARHKNGHWIWVEIALRRIGGASSESQGIIGSIRDVSQRHRQDEALEQAREAAEAASRVKAEFLANMSHELRTPLTGILGVHDLLQRDPTLSDPQRRLVGLAQESGRSLLLVVNDILDFSKMEEGKLDLAPVRFSVAALVENSVPIVTALASEKHLDVKVTTDENIPPYLIGDDGRLRQVLLNLLNNAIKFTPAGRIALTVERQGTSNREERLRFAVSDTGIGIPNDKIDRLFQRFSQVDGSTSREFGGSGLGLAISKRLIDLMGGEIGVESAPGKGSTFWFTVTLPVAVEAEVPALREQVAAAPTRSAQILLAEDNEVNQEIIRAMLDAAGHKVDIVADGAEAVMAVTAKDYDVILMDIQMPGMDGIAATTWIRALPGRASRIPIIAMTANVLPQQIGHFRSSGMDDHVGKPFKREELLSAIARRLPVVGTSIALSVGDDKPSIPAVHEETLEGLATLLGSAKVNGLLRKLGAQLDGRFANDPATFEERAILAREAHKLVSSSGMLGFVELSQSCASLETNIEGDVAASLDRVRRACVSALAEIASRLDIETSVMMRA
jgi:PAS domain S-box-containing protein